MLKYFFSIICLLFLILSGFDSKSGTIDTLNLEEVVISGRRSPAVYSEVGRVINVLRREDIDALPAQSLDALLTHVSGVDIRSRGPHDIQSDISIRGGTFDQALILINGIKVNDPQTGHHSLNVPVSLTDIERIEVLTGPGSRIFGANAFSGAINIITVADKEQSVAGGLMAGEYGLFNSNVSTTLNKGVFNNFFSYNYKTSDGYISNTDFDVHNFFLHSRAEPGQFKIDAQAGYQNKAFGANSFYSAAFPDQFEHTRTKFFSLKAETGDKVKISPVIYWRRLHDRFELFRYKSQPWYRGHNYHQTDIYGLELNTSIDTKVGKISLGVEFRSENIMSNLLGEQIDDSLKVKREPNGWYTHAKRRDNYGLFAEHTLYFERLIVTAGAFCHYNSKFGFQWYPGVDVAYRLSYNWQWFSSYNHALRLPTFTDLYYQGPDNISNPDLTPEKAQSVETGVKYFNNLIYGHISLFYRNTNNAIDWVKTDESSKWESKNHTNIQTTGFEANLSVPLKDVFSFSSPLRFLRLSYGYIYSDKETEDFISNYALDYLKHKFSYELQLDITNGLSASWIYSFRERNGKYFDFDIQENIEYKGFWLLDLKLQHRYNNIVSFLQISNIFDVEYVDFGNIQNPGRWIKAGISCRVGL